MVVSFGRPKIISVKHSQTDRQRTLENLVKEKEMHVHQRTKKQIEKQVICHIEIGLQITHIVKGVNEVKLDEGDHLQDENHN